MTPIILSGLLLANLDNNSTSNSTELVSFCQQMRRAALIRLRLRNKTKRVERIVTPILLLLVALVFYVYIVSNLRNILLEYGFVDDNSCCCCCEGDIDSGVEFYYSYACRHAEAYTWEKLNEVQPYQFKEIECTVKSCPLADNLNERIPFYVMHTRLEENIIPLEDVVTNQYRSRKRRIQQQQPHHHRRGSIDSKVGHQSEPGPLPVQWLGDSLTNRLVREAIKTNGKLEKYGDTFSICDVGAGLGGTLFSLLVNDLPFQQWRYHGISLSLPEVRRAKQLMKIHKISQKVVNVTFQQGNFDDPLPPKSYNAMIAIESLAYSHNVTKTLINLSSAMKPNGTLIVVEDVVAPWARKGSREMEEVINATAKYSLLTHQEWFEAFSLTGFTCDHHPPRDLSLEFDWVPNLDYESPTYESAVTSHVNNMLNRFLSWFGRVGRNNTTRSSSSMKGIAVRAIHLFEDLVLFSRARTVRHAAHARGDMQYMFYVCSKQ
jgi:2-polyprenyl-3-methyl-5-hydroxy-6-metoxy-1,4-benzoquinol methylase